MSLQIFGGDPLGFSPPHFQEKTETNGTRAKPVFVFAHTDEITSAHIFKDLEIPEFDESGTPSKPPTGMEMEFMEGKTVWRRKKQG